MKRTYFGISLLIISTAILLHACKKDDNNTAAAPGNNQLITKIIGPDASGIPGMIDTVLISYNADSSIHQITNSQTSGGTITFYYSSSLIKRVTTSAGNTEVLVDSIVLDAGGRALARYEIISNYPLYNTNQYYSYNTSGQLVRTIISYPNVTGMPDDTVTHSWSNGDMVSEISTSGAYDFTYSFDMQRPCQPGDPLYIAHLTESGFPRAPNAHLCTATSESLSTAAYTYGYDGNNRITQYIVTQDQKADTSYFQYAP
jgi:hypothetical protein